MKYGLRAYTFKIISMFEHRLQQFNNSIYSLFGIFVFQATTQNNDECIDTFQGTSAACPMAAGIIALVLESKCV